MTLADGTAVKEIHMVGHDDINIVLLEISGRNINYSPNGFSGIGPLVTIVPDFEKEKSFYLTALDFELCDEIELGGPEIEKMIGLPKGTTLKFGVLGDLHQDHGRIEVINYFGAHGNNLYAKIRGKNLGVLGVSYLIDDLENFKKLLLSSNLDHVNYGELDLLHTRGETISIMSPAGLRIEITQPN